VSATAQEPARIPSPESSIDLLPHLIGQDVARQRDEFFVRTPRVARLLAFLLDLVIIGGAAAGTLAWFSLAPGGLHTHELPAPQTAAVLLLFSALLVLSLRGLHLYIRPRRSGMFGDLAAIFYATAIAMGVVLLFFYLSQQTFLLAPVFTAAGIDLGSLMGWRAIRMKIGQRRVASGRGTRNVIIVGAGRVGMSLAAHLEQNKPLGYVVKGFLDQDHHQDPRLLGKIEDFSKIVRAHFVDEVLVTIPSERQIVRNLVNEAQEHGVAVKVIPELFDGLGLQAPIDYIGKFPTMELHREPIPRAGLAAKRAMDIAVAAFGLVVTAPLMALIALLIKLDSRGPVLYCSERVGKKGRRFVCYKFRSMVNNADALKAELRQNNNYRRGPTFKVVDDPRVTRLGGFLRRYSLDELPQLWNILLGDMSLVGPRPHPLDDFEHYDLEHMVRLHVKPGLTGLWQVMARSDPSFEKNMALDLEYIENWTLALDMKILLRTLPAVLHGNGQ